MHKICCSGQQRTKTGTYSLKGKNLENKSILQNTVQNASKELTQLTQSFWMCDSKMSELPVTVLVPFKDHSGSSHVISTKGMFAFKSQMKAISATEAADY